MENGWRFEVLATSNTEITAFRNATCMLVDGSPSCSYTVQGALPQIAFEEILVKEM
jgi:hypothetical protein